MAGFTVQRPSTKGPRHLKELGRRRWLIRHGESAANAGAVTTDPATIPLTEAGRDQARSIATTITRKPDLIVVSFYLRTQQTAEPSMRRFPDVLVETWPMQELGSGEQANGKPM